LPNPLIVAKDKYLILTDRATRGRAELIALERRFLNTARIVKEICSVEGAIAQELVRASVELVATGACHRINHSAGSSPILGGNIARQHREFFNGVDTHIAAENAAGSSVCEIFDADAVQSIVVLLRTRAVDGYLILKTTVCRD